LVLKRDSTSRTGVSRNGQFASRNEEKAAQTWLGNPHDLKTTHQIGILLIFKMDKK
jgi:hypothetical protein